MAYIKLLIATLALASADKLDAASRLAIQQRNQRSRQFQSFSRPNSDRTARQFDGGNNQINGGIDFSGCQPDPDTGFCCVEREETVTSLQKDPILECTHKNVEKCHYTYVTTFSPAQEEVCEENFEKSCQVTFKQQAFNETVRKCYRPLEKICNGQGPEECRTVYESSCTTRYIEKQPGKFVGDTNCEKLPVEICGAGCVTEEGPEECHEKVIASLVDVPEEVCDLNPQRTCRFQTKLVPSLKPKHECTIIPQEVCNLKFTQPEQVEKPLKTRWCLDPSAPAPGESYEESVTTPPVITSPPETATESRPQAELPVYEQPATLYSADDIRGGRAFSNADPFATLETPIEVPVNSFQPFQQPNAIQNQQNNFGRQGQGRRQQQQRRGRNRQFGRRRPQGQQRRQRQQRRQQQNFQNFQQV